MDSSIYDIKPFKTVQISDSSHPWVGSQVRIVHVCNIRKKVSAIRIRPDEDVEFVDLVFQQINTHSN